MTLHPEIARIVEQIPPASTTPPNPQAMREAEAGQVPPPEDRLPLHDVADTTASTPAGDVPVRIYTPVEADSFGLIVYFHGGAFFSGSLDTHDHVARSLAKETGHKVISVGYSLAPEAAFPTALNECLGVVKWAADSGDRLDWDGRNLALAGDSSGGNFVAAVTAMAHDEGFDRITHQVLYYPSVDLDFDRSRWPSLQENAEGYGLEYNGLAPFNSFYLDNGADPADPLVSPIKREDLSGLPKALIVTAGYDPLRDEGEAYGQRLEDAGVEVTTKRYDAANHGFVANFSWIPEFYEVFHDTARFLNEG
ncbi:alpha/beta hydrolase [Corynebacterium halotolerans]|uniref:Alpha/beta hydrolase n=1 Tax=Corynebacterium halotolerans YIM 70093 = DSM 44683 TaxID=1121362 RepID=M1P5Y6_9CORY|nr:alpha/beta hydrolase [Corynebacterium halotolerans]AGF72046.1 alpha/beta hydrolase [Corynebacterium halotolerans YIM 70093 = DSM 44683]